VPDEKDRVAMMEAFKDYTFKPKINKHSEMLERRSMAKFLQGAAMQRMRQS